MGDSQRKTVEKFIQKGVINVFPDIDDNIGMLLQDSGIFAPVNNC
jgi:hypothetical protein